LKPSRASCRKFISTVSGKTSQGVFNDLGEEVLPKGRNTP
jgi:hypothetical protein